MEEARQQHQRREAEPLPLRQIRHRQGQDGHGDGLLHGRQGEHIGAQGDVGEEVQGEGVLLRHPPQEGHRGEGDEEAGQHEVDVVVAGEGAAQGGIGPEEGVPEDVPALRVRQEAGQEGGLPKALDIRRGVVIVGPQADQQGQEDRDQDQVGVPPAPEVLERGLGMPPPGRGRQEADGGQQEDKGEHGDLPRYRFEVRRGAGRGSPDRPAPAWPVGRCASRWRPPPPARSTSGSAACRIRAYRPSRTRSSWGTVSIRSRRRRLL